MPPIETSFDEIVQDIAAGSMNQDLLHLIELELLRPVYVVGQQCGPLPCKLTKQFRVRDQFYVRDHGILLFKDLLLFPAITNEFIFGLGVCKELEYLFLCLDIQLMISAEFDSIDLIVAQPLRAKFQARHGVLSIGNRIGHSSRLLFDKNHVRVLRSRCHRLKIDTA